MERKDAGMTVSNARQMIARGEHADPFSVLGVHLSPNGEKQVCAWLPGAQTVRAIADTGDETVTLNPESPAGFFQSTVSETLANGYQLQIQWPEMEQQTKDPYSFGPIASDEDLWLHAEGTHLRPYQFLGAHVREIDGVRGTAFSIWAPNASAASVVGDFNSWNVTRHPMRLRAPAGVWEIFIPEVVAGARYKFALRGPDGQALPWHCDPYARASELRPATASIVSDVKLVANSGQQEHDEVRAAPTATRDQPVSVYEVHAGSWARIQDPDDNSADPSGRMLDWYEMADRLVPYVERLGFTHIELMPVCEFPFDGSWGYQPTGLFAPSARFGDMVGIRHFVRTCHKHDIGVLIDWVPGHFPADEHGLAQLDGTHLYEHADPLERDHPDWGSLIYNFGRDEVRCFLAASARYWVEEFGVDGIRVDAVASMLYRDYSREPGEWVPNKDGGRENYEAISLLQHVNASLGATHPDVVTVAEESTAWPGVTQRTDAGGLGFHYKWNMGWMNDSLRFMARDPAHRRFHLNEMTFSLVYSFSENFVLPISHDEVVHGKGSLLTRMPGDRNQQLANVRLYLAFMFAHPGKKLLFMGNEFAQPNEWNHDQSLDWHLVNAPEHLGVQQLVTDLNRTYRRETALHALDCESAGFRWLIADDDENTVLAFERRASDDSSQVVIAIFNFTPVARSNYQVGVPLGGHWNEILNTDAQTYGGGNAGNFGSVIASGPAAHGHMQSLQITLPPLSAIYLVPGDD
jgi:1,4-alpha-glucan branching enzyme